MSKGITLPHLLRSGLHKITYEDIRKFLQEEEPEGINLDYKAEINPKSLKKHFASFSNKRGGLIIIGIDEKKGISNAKGIAISDKDLEQISQIASNVDPLPVYEVRKIIGSNKKGFIFIRIFAGIDTPYVVFGDPKIYIRIGDISKDYLEIAKPEELKILFTKKEEVFKRRLNVQHLVKETFQAHIKAGEQERLQRIENGESTVDSKLGDDCRFVESLIIPSFPIDKKLCSELSLKQFPAMERVHFGYGGSLPSNSMRFISIPRGMTSFSWNYLSGGIENLQVYLDGSIYYASDILEAEKEKDDYIFLSRVWYYLVLSLRFARSYYTKFGYNGSLYWQVKLNNIQGIAIKGISVTFAGMKKALLDTYLYEIEINTLDLLNSDQENGLEYNIFKELLWYFGFDFTNIDNVYNNFLKENRL